MKCTSVEAGGIGKFLFGCYSFRVSIMKKNIMEWQKAENAVITTILEFWSLPEMKIIKNFRVV